MVIFCKFATHSFARMAKLADALYSGCSIRKDVQVQVLFRALYALNRSMRMCSWSLCLYIFLTAAIQLHAQYPDTRSAYQKGMQALQRDDITTAIQAFELWTNAMPNDAMAFVKLASCHARMGNDTATIISLDKAILAGLNDIYLIEQDTAIRAIITRRPQLAIALSSFFWGYNDPWMALLHNAHEQADSRRFPIGFTEQKRLARYRILFPKSYDSTKKYRAMLLLHGNGLDPVFMLKWATTLHLDSFIVIAPEAPYIKFKESLQSGDMKLSGRGEDQSFPDSLNTAIISQTCDWYHSALQHAKSELPFNTKEAIVMGFSQGGFFASVLLSTYPESFSTAITLCGSMYKEGNIESRLPTVKSLGKDILIVHGRQDSIVPFTIAEKYVQQLSQAHVQHAFISFEGGHWPADEVLDDILQWIESH